MKIGFICDTHMPCNKMSPQYAFFEMAVAQCKKDHIDTIVHLGDITSFGEQEVFEDYLKTMRCFPKSYYVLGNAEIRCKETQAYFLSKTIDIAFPIQGRTLIGVNTPFGTIDEEDKHRLFEAKDGDILFMHHGPHKLHENDKQWIEVLLSQRKLTLIHAHSHKWFDYTIGKSRVIGLRALDPDKSIGNYPCITYMDVTESDITIEEKMFCVDKDTLQQIRENLGLSCVDNHTDVAFAAKADVKNIELRCNNADWEPDLSLLPKVQSWRKVTNGYLSVHMPNLKWDGKEIQGIEQWYQAVDYAVALQADGLTMHPPRIRKSLLLNDTAIWEQYLELYLYAVKKMDTSVKIGIENIHKLKSEEGLSEEDFGFGYTPSEVSFWIDAINQALGGTRVGHVLDVGHARNNGELSSRFPISRWYEQMGSKIVAYHIHQVLQTEDGLKNHNAIEDWFGPLISYASFFYAWEKEMIQHSPIFLEVRGIENFQKSLNSFLKLL